MRYIVVDTQKEVATICDSFDQALQIVSDRVMAMVRIYFPKYQTCTNLMNLKLAVMADGLGDECYIQLNEYDNQYVVIPEGSAVDMLELFICEEGAKGAYRAFVTSDRQNYVSPWEGTESDDDIVANDDPTFFETVGQSTGTDVTGKK